MWYITWAAITLCSESEHGVTVVVVVAVVPDIDLKLLGKALSPLG
jgi:hypothetical protein